MSIIYLLLCPAVSKDFYYPLLFPVANREPQIPARLKEVCKEVTFSSGDHDLHGWYLKNPSAKYTVILHHGNEGNVERWSPYMENISKQGFSVLLYDYEGYGRSSGRPTMQGILADGQAAFDFLVSSNLAKPENVVNFGTSLGSAVATHVAATRPSKALILWSPYSSLLKTCRNNFPLLNMYPDFFFPEDDIGCRYDIASISVPVLILHGTDDSCIDFAQAQELHSTKPSTRLVELSGAGHVCERWFKRGDVQSAMQNFVENLKSQNHT